MRRRHPFRDILAANAGPLIVGTAVIVGSALVVAIVYAVTSLAGA